MALLPPEGPCWGRSAAGRALQAQVARVAACAAPVMLIGPSGCGKEVVARAIHAASDRAGRPFVAVDCAALPAALIEAQLFGHERGSFTGAHARTAGYFEHASGGTLFLDEVTGMAPEMQVRLLRALETGSFHRIGGSEPVQCDLRVIAATHHDPRVAVREGRFREDLLYRLAVLPLRVPALHERRDDIEPLAQHFLAEFNARAARRRRFSAQALKQLRERAWPGNVRELRNAVQRLFIMADEIIDDGRADLPAQPADRGCVFDAERDALKVRVGVPLADLERDIILATLNHHAGDKRLAARTLGVSLKTLYNRLDVYRRLM
ncbi:sigma 54-interacting transcriptional regulator [Derxia gummosa]|uniref:Sigma 54-interacting transcriptional regulator n=1 Tax=Derxia gummosa DSM 723 TaxID=1121388 RepID=A0A9U5CWV3_9BURK|nr:sigma-54 dependent transcriptional regulator [Derxia gummosa]